MSHELFVIRGLLAALKLITILAEDGRPLALATKAVSVLMDSAAELGAPICGAPSAFERMVEEGRYENAASLAAKMVQGLAPIALAHCESEDARQDIKDIFRA